MDNTNDFDVIIIGAGPAGIFTALELVKLFENCDSKPKIAIFEKGKPIEDRHCPRMKHREEPENCFGCKDCAMISGWGGSGAYSDGKLTLSTDIGGWLKEYLDKDFLVGLLDETAAVYIQYGADKNRLVDPFNNFTDSEHEQVENFRRTALAAGIELVPFKNLHIGTDVCYNCLKNMYSHLKSQSNVSIFCREHVESLVANGGIIGVETGKKTYHAKYIVAASGREGAGWLRSQAEKLKLETAVNPVDIGVRVEIPAELSKPLTDLLYEFKCIYYAPTFDQRVRTFCVCPEGIVTTEHLGSGIVTVNGHSYAEKSKRTRNTNFAILVTSNFTTPFNEPILYGEHIARLANLISGGQVIIQRLADLKRGRRSTENKLTRSTIVPTLKDAIPGDLSFVLPYRHLVSIVEFLKALNAIIPGIDSNNTLLYGVETKFYSSKIAVTKDMEVKTHSNLYTIGDGAGITRGLVQASASGLIAARSIAKKFKEAHQ